VVSLPIECPECGRRFEHDPAVDGRVVCPVCEAELLAPACGATPPSSEAPTETQSAASRPAPDDPLIGASLGEFQIVEAVGRGGMGAVYRACQPALSRFVAIKVLPERFAADSDFIERFRREARAAAAIRHPNIIEVYTVGRDAGREFIAMEFVEGGSLAALLRREGRLAPDRALELLKQAASALAKAHAVGVLHRDIKPGNLLLTSDGLLKVADFGLAKHEGVDVSVTASGAALGTPLYMAPEVSEGHPADPRSDLYSLGATFYQAIAGRPPFDGQTPAELARKRLTTEVTPLAQLVPACPRGLCRVIHGLIQRDPADRYPNAQHLLEALNAIESPAAPEQGTDSSTDLLGVSTGRGEVRHAERSRGISPKAPDRRDSSTSQGSARNDRGGELAAADVAADGAGGPPRRRGWRRWPVALGAAAALIAIVAAAYVLFFRPTERPPDIPGEVVLRTGKLLFRTERFEPPKPKEHGRAKPEDHTELSRFPKDDVSEVELAFQLLNQSNQLVTLSSVKVATLGALVVNDDSVTAKFSTYMKHIMLALPERTDLGALDVTVGRETGARRGDSGDLLLAGPRASGALRAWDLLQPNHLETVEPNSIRSFLVRLRCRRTLLGGDLYKDVRHLLFLDLGDSRELSCLDVEPPQPDDVDHAFTIVVDTIAEGERHMLCSDWVYALSPAVGTVRLRSDHMPQGMPLARWYGVPPAEFVRQLLPRGVKTHSETLAYRIAKESGRVPVGFDPDTVSPYCYYHDKESPFRQRSLMAKKGNAQGGKKPRLSVRLYADAEDDGLFIFGERVERSNIVALLAGVAKEHPVLWVPMEAELKRMESCGDKVLERKARFVREQLAAAKEPRPAEPSR